MNMIDAASGGALFNMSPHQARDLISMMATNTQQFRANPEPTRRVHQLRWLNQYRKGKEEKEILETFKNIKINISLLDAIKQILRYAKFFKKLCTNKRKLTGDERVSVGENVSAVLQ
ncbi:hypothetical protein CXB51_019448 [Gossypium anomalum]|uniref:Uncharacterized protein n=1 Tax=Gossypium anomalum TaxID=47600 RepID=A0A8J6CSR3_9ROSI|nr:hypothetical protein CXB51_019448 [Gossypium anomalum]